MAADDGVAVAEGAGPFRLGGAGGAADGVGVLGGQRAAVGPHAGALPQRRARGRRFPRTHVGVRRAGRRGALALERNERPKSAVGKAIVYALRQWDGLQTYLTRGEVPIDNNGVENAIRPCALGKKNCLFIGAVHAGQRAAHFYTLLGSCLRRGLNPRAYLQWLFALLPTATTHTVGELTPAAYAAGLASENAARRSA